MHAPAPSPVPVVTVLLATYNGLRWLPDQMRTILDQQDVEVRVIVLDDGSSDGTAAWLAEQAAADPRITVLPTESNSGSASANFYRLILRAEMPDADYIAFADQDDLWIPGKLARHIALLRAEGHDGVSSDITAFTGERRTLIRKSHPQRAYDYVCEGPGPGSTFLMTPRLIALVRELLATDPGSASVDSHDWFVYAVARARGWTWLIDDVSSVDYRQHDDNAMGANVGGASALSRFALIRSRWHREQSASMVRVGLLIAPAEVRPGLERLNTLITTPGWRPRWRLARMAPVLRRRVRDRLILGVLIAVGIW